MLGIAFVSLLIVTLVPGASWASSVIHGQVTAEGSPVARATVFIAGGGDIRSASTDVDGRYSIDVPNDTYTVSVRAPGYSAATATGIDVADATFTHDVALSASSFSPLPVFGGAQEGVVADGRSGVFCAPADVVPPVARLAPSIVIRCGSGALRASGRERAKVAGGQGRFLRPG